MKKFLCLMLTTLIALSCICIPASGGITASAENGVQVEIAPFLYKSTLYQMEFPSVADYSTKEKSVEGDYAISRELNDLAYVFTFPAGTTEIACKVSLDGETNWRGFEITYETAPNYWPKDDSEKIDFTKPVVFKRDEALAEQDEYGLLYRE